MGVSMAASKFDVSPWEKLSLLSHKMSDLSQLHTFDKSHGLKTSLCQCLVIDIAPPAGNRKLLVLH